MQLKKQCIIIKNGKLKINVVYKYCYLVLRYINLLLRVIFKTMRILKDPRWQTPNWGFIKNIKIKLTYKQDNLKCRLLPTSVQQCHQEFTETVWTYVAKFPSKSLVSMKNSIRHFQQSTTGILLLCNFLKLLSSIRFRISRVTEGFLKRVLS